METYLIWFIIAAVCLVSELFVTGFVLAFFAVGALTVSLVTLVWSSMDLEYQFLLFSVATILSLILLRKHLVRVFRGDQTENNESETSDDIIGRTGVAVEAIVPGKSGQIRMRGTYWPAISDTAIEKDASISVIGRSEHDRSTLIVKPQ